MGQHYDENGDSEWACGGDGDCDAVQAEPDCVSGYRHRWTSRGCGGCDSNPGVWSLGGTAYQYGARCLVCGTQRTEVHHGWQRNPGECDSVSYETGDADEAEARAEMRRQDRNRRRRASRRRAKAEATSA